MSRKEEVLCRYYASGCCKRGDDCGFLHDFKGKMNMICTFYLQGNCSYGSTCRYDHRQPSDLKTNLNTKNMAQKNSKNYQHNTVPQPIHSTNSGSQEQIVPRPINREPMSHTQANGYTPIRPQADDQHKFSGTNDKPASTHMPIHSEYMHTLRPQEQSTVEETCVSSDVHFPSDFQSEQLAGQVKSMTILEATCASKLEDGSISTPIKTRTLKSKLTAVSTTTSFATVAGTGVMNSNEISKSRTEGTEQDRHRVSTNSILAPYVSKARSDILCPFAMAGKCAFGASKCKYIHGDVCEGCEKQCLHPVDVQQRHNHESTCASLHGSQVQTQGVDVESSYAYPNNNTHLSTNLYNKTSATVKRKEYQTFPSEHFGGEGVIECGICLEVVEDKESLSDRRFGVLDECAHPFCLSCIRKWRSERDSNKENARSCPICKQQSYFVIPSTSWPGTVAEKEALIQGYRSRLRQTKCMYFNNGDGECPFGTSCFYRHEYRDGTLAEVTLRKYGGEDGLQIHKDVSLWDFMAKYEDGH
eukprot:CFRG3012T1